jgi:aminoglycoside 3-N-acetyltransferase
MTDDLARAQDNLVADLRALGVRPGQDLLVHSSLRRIGPVAGGAATVLRALQTAAGPDATLVVPAQTPANSLSSRAFREKTAGRDRAALARFVAAMPGFDPQTTPSQGVGTFAEYVRTTPGAVRSAHPQSSFAALGPRAADCTAGHEMTCHLGQHSPLGWLYRADAAVILLGVGYASCTAFHLAEYLLPVQPRHRPYRCFTQADGAREEHAFYDIDLDESDFETLGTWLDREAFVRRGRVGNAVGGRLLPLRSAVDFAVAWPPFRRRRAVS